MTPQVLVALTLLLRCADLCEGRVLLFVAVDSRPHTQQLLQKNVARMREQDISCDVVLGLYQGRVSDLDQDWYNREVSHAVVGKGYKFHLMQQAYKDMHATNPWEKNYEYIWALDSDIDITQADVLRLLAMARVTGSPIVGPTFVSSGALVTMAVTGRGQLLRKHGLSPRVHHRPQHPRRGPNAIQNPNASCDYRHTDFVELTAPLLSPKVLEPLLEACTDCIQKRSDWGLDMMWCKYVSDKFAVQGCALIDKVSVVHLDWGLARVNRNFYNALHRVEASYKQYWSNHITLSCELEPDAHEVANIRDQHHKGKHLGKKRSKAFQKTVKSNKKKKKKETNKFTLHSHAQSFPARHDDHHGKKHSALHKEEHHTSHSDARQGDQHKKPHGQLHFPGDPNADQDAMLKSEDADEKVYAEGYPWEDPVIREGRLIGTNNRREHIWIVTDKAGLIGAAGKEHKESPPIEDQDV